MAERAILATGRICRLVGDMEAQEVVCKFHLGRIPCRATAPLSMEIIAHRGYPDHEIKVVGHLLDKKVLVVDKLELVD